MISVSLFIKTTFDPRSYLNRINGNDKRSLMMSVKIQTRLKKARKTCKQSQVRYVLNADFSLPSSFPRLSPSPLPFHSLC